MKHLSIFLSSLLLLVLCACGGSNSGEVYKNAGLAEADTLLEASYNAFDNNNFAKAQEYGEKALAIYTEAGDTLNQRDCYTHLCACYMRTSDAEKAITMGFKALHIDSLRQDHEAMGSEYNNIAAVYLSIKDNDNARKFIDRSLEMDRVVGDAKSASVHLGIACEVYNKLGLYEEALQFATLAYEKDKEANDSLKMGRRLSQMADVFAAMGDYPNAEKRYLESNEMMKSRPKNVSVCINMKQLGNLYLKMGNRSEAVNALEKSAQMARSMGVRYLLLQDLEILADIYKTQQPVLAVSYMQQANALKDSIYNDRTSELKENFAAKYEMAKKQDTIEEQKAMLTNHKIVIWGIFAMVLLLLFLSVALFYIARLRSQKQSMVERMNSQRQDFLADITHEFRTPITVIQGQANRMKEKETDPQCKKACDAIIGQSDVLLNLVNQLLDITKVRDEYENDGWRTGDVVAMMRMVIESLRINAADKLITTEFEPKQPQIEMDFVPGFMQKIIANLISNSLKFTPRGGRIIVTVRKEGDKVVVNIADTGVGIAPQDLPHIFEPSYKGLNTEANLGTSISLSLTQQMVLTMKGTIEVKSIEGKGTLFTITLPQRHSNRELPRWIPSVLSAGTTVVEPGVNDKQAPVVEDDDNAVADGSQLQVLLVEDNSEVARYMREILSEKYRVMYAPNGKDALAKALEYVPDIIVTDLMMPEMDGYQLCRYVRQSELLKHLPILVVTARSENTDRIKSYEAGADAFITKPFSSEELMLRVEKLIEQRQVLRDKYSKALLDDSVEQIDTSAADQKFMSQLHQILQANMGDTALGSTLVAEKMFISQRQLNRKVKMLTNVDTATYIREFRIIFAKQMLKNTDSSITDIYIQCGFESPSYFSKIFKQSVGMTPTEYRKKNRGS